jgi:predicted Zn-dependent protease
MLLTIGAVSGCTTAPETGRSQFIMVSEAEAAQMGAQAYSQIRGQKKISTNADYNNRVRRIGQRIAAISPKAKAYKWEFTVFEDDNPNAFALPGGKVGVHTGLFKVAKNDAQLATVMAHEVAHAIARHGEERMSQGTLVQLGLGVLGASTGINPGAFAQAATLGVILPFSRSQESEADVIGLLYMARAGYDPRQSVNLWQNFANYGDGKRPPEFLSTHPSPGSRIQKLQANMPRAMQEYQKSPYK